MLTFWVVEKILGERQYREAAVGVNISLNGNMTMEELSIYLDANLARMSRIKSEPSNNKKDTMARSYDLGMISNNNAFRTDTYNSTLRMRGKVSGM